MNKSALLISASMLFFTTTASYAGEGTLTIPKKIPFKKGLHIPDAVRKECNLQAESARFIREAVKGYDKVVQTNQVSSSTPGKALTLTITGLLAPGGGAFSGPKSVTIEGTLWYKGKSQGNFKAMRHTSRGYNTCGMLHNDVEEIADDIAEWLKSPKRNAKLGDAAD